MQGGGVVIRWVHKSHQDFEHSEYFSAKLWITSPVHRLLS